MRSASKRRSTEARTARRSRPADAWTAATEHDLKPQKLTGTLAFMFETRYPLIPTGYAAGLPALQEDYQEVWSSLRRRFEG